MAATYTSLLYHLVFRTKNRERWITPDVEARVWAYLGGIASEKKRTPSRSDGIEDYVGSCGFQPTGIHVVFSNTRPLTSKPRNSAPPAPAAAEADERRD